MLHSYIKFYQLYYGVVFVFAMEYYENMAVKGEKKNN